MLFLCTTQGCISDDEPQGNALSEGDSLPLFTVTLSNGRIIDNDSFIGKAGLILFFNTSCSDCRKELPVVQQVWEHFSDNKDVLIVAISREQDEESVARYWRENNLSIPYSAQSSREVYSLFAPSVIPRIFISDSEGIITFSSGDSDMPDAAALISAINKNL